MSVLMCEGTLVLAYTTAFWYDQGYFNTCFIPWNLCISTFPGLLVFDVDFERRTREGSTTVGGKYLFAVPSSSFKVAWAAHSAAISSVSWIESPPSLLSASADGLARIWTPDGNTLLGQVSSTFRRHSGKKMTTQQRQGPLTRFACIYRQFVCMPKKKNTPQIYKNEQIGVHMQNIFLFVLFGP